MSGEISGSTLLKRCEWDETEMNVLRKQVCMLQVMIGCRGRLWRRQGNQGGKTQKRVVCSVLCHPEW